MIRKKLVGLLLRLMRRMVRLLSTWEMASECSSRGTDSGHMEKVIQSTTAHDMYGNADEQYYRKQYWYWIGKALRDFNLPNSGIGLDLGCGQGRLTTLLGGYLCQGSVTGVDISGHAIAQARRYAEMEGVRNVVYLEENIPDTLNRYADNSVDVVLMTEVVFFFPEWRPALTHIRRILKSGGIVCMAFRPLYHDALNLVGKRMFEKIDMLLTSRGGNLLGGSVKFTWQTSAEIGSLMEDMEMELLELVGIGCCSGIEGGPHAHLVRPSSLDGQDADSLMKLELALGPELPDAGRYMLAIARK